MNKLARRIKQGLRRLFFWQKRSCHPLYSAKKEEKSIVEIKSQLHDAQKRIVEIEGCNNTTNKQSTTTSILKETAPGRVDSHSLQKKSCASNRPEQVGAKSPGALESTPMKVRQTGNRSRSESNTPLKLQRKESRSSKAETRETRETTGKSQNKIRTLPRKLSEGPLRDKHKKDNGSSKMQDSSIRVSKSAPTSRKATPILQRLRSVTECLGGENPRRTKEKEKLLAKVESLSRETSPLREKTGREMPRVKALGLVSSISAEALHRATTAATSRFESTMNNQMDSDDEADCFNSRTSVERLSPSVAQMSNPVELNSAGRDLENKDLSKGPHKPSTVQYSSRGKLEKRGTKEDLSDQSGPDVGNSPLQSPYSAEREINRGEEARPRVIEHGAESQRRDEAAWTALRLQEQFGEALKELGGLQDRHTTGSLNMNDKCYLHGNVGIGGVNRYQQIGSPLQGNNGNVDKMHYGWKSGLHDLGEGEAYFKQRDGEGCMEYLNGESEKSGRNSPDKTPGPRKRAKPRDVSNGEHKVEDERPSFASRPHSRDGSEKSDPKENLRGVREDCARFRVQMKALKEMAEDSRIREFALHQDKEPVAKRPCDEDHANLKETNKRDVKPRKSVSRDGKAGAKWSPEFGNDSARGESDVDDRRRNSGSGQHPSSSRPKHIHSSQPKRQQSKNKNNAKSPRLTVSPPRSITPPTSSSSSSSSSSLSSLPLSHYIQKLKHLAPESKFLPSPPNQSGHRNSGFLNPSKALSKFPLSLSVNEHKHHYRLDLDNCKTVDSEYEGRHGTSPAAILLPKSPPSSHTLSARIQQRIGNLYKAKPEGEIVSGRHADSDQRLDAVLGGCALVASHLQRQISPERRDRRERLPRSQKFLTSKETSGGHDCLLSFVGPNRHEKQTEAFDGTMAGLQRLVGELKGSVEGFKIRIEVEGEGWRSRVEGLEKEIETLKDETDDELMELKKCIRNEIKVRMSELTAEVERMRMDEKLHVESLVQARIESHFNNNNNAAVVDLKKEIRSLWSEVEILTKEREDVKHHMERLAHMSEEAKENSIREFKTLRRDLHIDGDGGDMKKEAEERTQMRQDLEKIKDEGLDLKMEVNGLKRGEKGMKADLEHVKKMAEKIQEETEEMERDRGAAQMEGVRERLLIMERVESLSQLYLGGLEEVRTDVYNVKFHCRDRMDELESQWGEYKRQRDMGYGEDHSCVQKQRLLHEMEHFRSEVSDILKTERGLLRDALEREHECIRRQMIEIGNSNKNELSCMIKVEMQKRNQAAKDKLMCLPEPMKRDMDRLKLDFEEAQQGAEAIAQTLATVERDRDIAAQAAADASSAAAKAGEVLSKLLGPFSSEIAATRRKSLALQDNIASEKDAAIQALAEAKKKSAEFQEFLLQEKTGMRHAVAIVQHERDAAAAAASDASNSAIKAGEVLAEVLGSFNQEMNKARRKSSQLHEGLDRERENLQRDREGVIKKSHEAQERFNEELEKAITSWKRAMDQEVGKAKQITGGLEEERQRLSLNREQMDGNVKGDLEYIQKTNEALTKLRLTVKNLEDSAQTSQQEKHRRRSMKQDLKSKKEQDLKMEYSKLRETIDEALRREDALRDLVDESASRVKKLEGMHIDLLQSFQEVRASTGDLEKTASIWLPKYENAARIVHDISCKVEKLEEKCKGVSAEEGLMQNMAHDAESKFESLKDMAASGTNVKDLFQKMESSDRTQSQALSMLDARVSNLESAVGHGREALSLKLEYIENRADLAGDVPNNVAGLSQTVEALQRKVEVLAAPRAKDDEKTSLMGGTDGALEVHSRMSSLESRIELVASATFTNLRLLDTKVEECTANARQALEGAATAENKCSALGAELVKVFRMLATSRQASPALAQRTRSPPSCGRDHSPTKTQTSRSPGPSPPRIRSGPSPPRIRSPLQMRLQMPNPVFRRGTPAKPRNTSDFTRSTLASEMRKVTTRSEQVETEEEYILLGDRGDPARDRVASRDQRFQVRENETVTQALCVHEEQPSDKGAQEFTRERTTSVQEGEIKGLRRLTVSQDRADDKHKDGGSKCQRTNIRLEAGRIHVNVSHRSGAPGNRERKSGTDHKTDLVAVQL
ncbi:hypothetical protein Mapa_007914 [Marchantia paleacea]|nr:hypothetical protein Mapa_007914 [Marchantia paleacea]